MIVVTSAMIWLAGCVAWTFAFADGHTPTFSKFVSLAKSREFKTVQFRKKIACPFTDLFVAARPALKYDSQMTADQINGHSTRPGRVFVTRAGLPLSIALNWPFHRSTSGADFWVLHGEIRLEATDGLH